MIKFGTSGWRGIIGEDFTFDNVRLATQAIAEYLTTIPAPPSKTLILGYDTRFLGREFSLAAAEVSSKYRPEARPPSAWRSLQIAAARCSLARQGNRGGP